MNELSNQSVNSVKIPIFTEKKLNMKKTLLFVLSFIFAFNVSAQEGYVPGNENIKSREDFRDSRFGIFIHWGLYSMLGQGEWVMNRQNIDWREYAKLARAFYPADFDAEKWVLQIKASGAKYITITSRHHDGFSMFGTKQSDFNIVDATPFGRDVLKELAAACEKHGVRLHFYYSHLDWRRGDYFPLGNTGKGTNREKTGEWSDYLNFMKAQLSELLTNYGKVGAIWFDGMWDKKPIKGGMTADYWDLSGQYSLIHSLQPSCLVANNHHIKPFPGEDIQLYERDLPGENTAGYSEGQEIADLPLETCQTMNGDWGYVIKDRNYKSWEELITLLVKAAGKGGNLLLNIGPQPNGELPELAVIRLSEMGEWMKKYSATVQGTRAGLVPPQEWGVSTISGNTMYLHILDRNTETVSFDIKGYKVLSVKEFDTDSKLKFTKDKDRISVSLPQIKTSPDYILKVELKIL